MLAYKYYVRVSSILVLVILVTTRVRRRSIFFPTSRYTQEKGKIQVPTSYLQESLSKFFLALRVAQVKEAKGFFSDELLRRSRTWKPLNSARAGLSPKIKGT